MPISQQYCTPAIVPDTRSISYFLFKPLLASFRQGRGKMRQKIGKCAMRYAIKKQGIMQ